MKNVIAPLVNGVFGNSISLADRGFNYGDGLFETIALIERELPLWPFHCERLTEGCERLKIPLEPSLVVNYIKTFVQNLPEQITHGVVKIVVTRGEGGRGYAVPEPVTPTICITYHDFAPCIDQVTPNQIRLGLCQLRLSSQPLLAGIKHLNRLENVIARTELQHSLVDDGVLLDADEHVIETTSANIFVVKNNRIITPSLDAAGVNGVARRFIIQHFSQLFDSGNRLLAVEKLSVDDLLGADEIFCTNSIWGVRVVQTFENNAWSRWPTAAAVQNYLSEYVSDFLASRKKL